jgi:hypothetical protein
MQLYVDFKITSVLRRIALALHPEVEPLHDFLSVELNSLDVGSFLLGQWETVGPSHHRAEVTERDRRRAYPRQDGRRGKLWGTWTGTGI